MNTSQPIRRSARIAAATAATDGTSYRSATATTSPISIRTASVPVKTSQTIRHIAARNPMAPISTRTASVPVKTSQTIRHIAARNPTTPISIRTASVPDKTSQVKTRHSRRLALRQRPNYSEPEEWEVEDPIYTSNTVLRTGGDLPEPDRTKFLEDVARMKKVLDRAVDMSLPTQGRHRATIDSFYWSRMSAYLIPMYPKFRATLRDKIREFETQLANGEGKKLTGFHRMDLVEELALNKEALANAHRSPWFVAAS